MIYLINHLINQKRFIHILIFIMFLIVIGCDSSRVSEVKEQLEIKEEQAFMLEKKIGEELGLVHPTSLVWSGKFLYITDTGNDRVVVINNEGKLVKIIGEPGNGKLQFIKPTGITIDSDGYIYIVDSGNNRIQVLDSKDNFIKKYAIEQFPYVPDSSYLNDAAVVNDTIYITTETMDKKWAGIIAISESGEYQVMGKELIGQVINDKDNIKFVSQGEFVKYEEQLGFESGRNYLIDILPTNELGDTYELPYKYTPSDIQFHNQELYMFSKAYFSLDQYDISGNYIKTVYRFRGEINELMGLQAFSFVGDDVFVLNNLTSILYLLKHTGN